MAKHRSFRLTPSRDECSDRPSTENAEAHSQAIVFAAVQQAIVLLLAALILDGGYILRICTIAAIASWVATLVIIVRRSKHPSAVDLAIVRYGFWMTMLVVLVVATLVRVSGL